MRGKGLTKIGGIIQLCKLKAESMSSVLSEPVCPGKPKKWLEQMQDVMRLKQYSRRTERLLAVGRK